MKLNEYCAFQLLIHKAPHHTENDLSLPFFSPRKVSERQATVLVSDSMEIKQQVEK